MNKLIILPYAMSSKSTKVLAEALECKRINVKRATYQGYSNHIVINWGSRKHLPNLQRCREVLNKPNVLSNASNKLKCFKLLKDAGVPTVEWTESRNEAYRWLNEGSAVFSRTSLGSHSGRGIVVNKPDGEFIANAPLYTKNFEKTREYRVHVFRDNLIVIQQKKLKSSENRTNEPDEYVWNHEVGQRVFARNNVDLEGDLKERLTKVAIDSINALGLDFGAVDVGTKDTEDIRVFEVNTACGLTGSTIEDYSRVFKEYLDESF